MKNKIKNLNLSEQFTIIIFTCFFIPLLLLFFYMFSQVKETLIQSRMNECYAQINHQVTTLDKNTEIVQMVTQLLISNNNLKEYLEQIDQPSTYEQHDEFYQYEIKTIEKIVMSNPYLYQVRIYPKSETKIEFMPILYKQERLQRMGINPEEITSPTWIVDYRDQIFASHVMNPVDHIMGLFTPIYNDLGEPLGIIEVALAMDDLLPSYFMSEEGVVVALQNEEETLVYQDQLYFDQVNDEPKKQELLIQQSKISAFDYDITHVYSFESLENQLVNWQVLLFVTLFIISFFLYQFFKVLVNRMLKRFYTIFCTVQEVKSGNLAVRNEDLGNDEVGELGKQINGMLDHIQDLMQDNIDREVLNKNSEIRALQNQINAHFIYNVLESIKMMAEIDGQYMISDAVTSLGKLLRYSMKWTSKNVTMKEEIDYINNYLQLINLRFDYTISLVLDIEPGLMNQLIPKMSLQPIIENAVIHGIEEAAEDTTITIRTRTLEQRVLIEIVDYGKGMNEQEIDALYEKIAGSLDSSGGSGNGIGLKNVQDRIKMTFGELYGMTFDGKKGEYTKVILELPYHSEGMERK